jgi:hypothetical protein
MTEFINAWQEWWYCSYVGNVWARLVHEYRMYKA